MTPTDGHIRVSFEREPSYFGASVVEGTDHRTVVCRDMHSLGRIVGMGSRATRLCWVNGAPHRVGYLSGLRIRAECRGVGLLARGYYLLRQIHEQDPLPFYLTTIAAGNDRAWRLLTSGRAGLPDYQHICDYVSVAIPLSRQSRTVPLPQTAGRYQLRLATQDDVPELVEFWKRCGCQREFFPVYDCSAFDADAGMLRGMRPEDVLIAYCGGKLVGTLAAWDQSAFRQSVVHDYGSWIAQLRPVINGLARLRGRAGLPSPGERLNLVFAAVPVIDTEHYDCFSALLRIQQQLASGVRHRHLVVGLCDHDPLLSVLSRQRATAYRTRLCVVRWDRHSSTVTLDRHRPPYLEVGSL